MAVFEFPKIDLHSFRVDTVAASILPEEAQSGYLPVMVKGDGNCLFWSASVFAFGEENQHNILRTLTMKEMDENAEYYDDQILHRATTITEVDSLSLSVNCLLMQELGKEASGVFSQCLQEKLSPREAIVHGLRCESAVPVQNW